MQFEWNEDKAETNLRKHRIDFADAIDIFKDSCASHTLDETMDYGEDRFTAVGFVRGVVLIVIYTERDERVRLISARKATKREEHNHLKERGAWQD